MASPPTQEGIEVYKCLFKLENLLKFMIGALEKIECHGYLVFGLRALKKSTDDLHQALDSLRVSLGRDLPTPGEIRDMGGPGGGK